MNQIFLFRRNCSLTGKSIITNYTPDAPYKVYAQPVFFSDDVNGLDVGRDFDFSRPFFDQFYDLGLVAPRPALFTDYVRDENSDYTNYAGLNKDCYFIFDSDQNWECLYGYSVNSSRSSLELYRAADLELCCEIIDSRRCYNSVYLTNCEGCSDSALLMNCIGCRNCICCSNLHHKQYYAFNKPVSPAQFAELRKQLHSRTALKALLEQFREFRKAFPLKALQGFQNENVSENYLTNCKNAFECFDCRDLWDGKFCVQMFMKAKDCLDLNECGDGELLYECANLGYNTYNVRFSLQCLSQLTNLTYCNYCFNGCSDLFGCIGLQRKSFCILNKQYSKSEYEALLPRVVNHMIETGEWGEFLPAWMTAFPYNLSNAQEHFPLSKEHALAEKFLWHDFEVRSQGAPKGEVPDDIGRVLGDLTTETFSCAGCAKPFRIIPAELRLYQTIGLALPRSCFECRHRERFQQRLPRQLWERSCSVCGLPVRTAVGPHRPEPVACEPCFQNAFQ